MKTKILSLLLFISFLASAQQAAKINFEQSLERAKTENKNVLLYFSGSDWCGPCVKFKKHFVETTLFMDFSNENLILFNADFPRLKKNQLPDNQVKENDALAEKYNSKGIFPLILLLNSRGEILKKWEQYPSETLEDFISKLKV
jgi:thioredoxin-related protein